MLPARADAFASLFDSRDADARLRLASALFFGAARYFAIAALAGGGACIMRSLVL
jgi:hypothetical protein